MIPLEVEHTLRAADQAALPPMSTQHYGVVSAMTALQHPGPSKTPSRTCPPQGPCHLRSFYSALLPLPQMPDCNPEPFRSHLEVVLHGLNRTPSTPGSLPKRPPQPHTVWPDGTHLLPHKSHRSKRLDRTSLTRLCPSRPLSTIGFGCCCHNKHQPPCGHIAGWPPQQWRHGTWLN